jgi:hypothetical protein
MTQEALDRIAKKLRRAGANLPAPEVTGTIEGSVVTGLCIALALVESETEALAQPEQEPVFTYEQVKAHIQVAMMSTTTPPQRTWVGLTDAEIKAFDTWHDNREEEVGWVNPSEIVAYIEAKLKEKNT